MSDTLAPAQPLLVTPRNVARYAAVQWDGTEECPDLQALVEKANGTLMGVRPSRYGPAMYLRTSRGRSLLVAKGAWLIRRGDVLLAMSNATFERDYAIVDPQPEVTTNPTK